MNNEVAGRDKRAIERESTIVNEIQRVSDQLTRSKLLSREEVAIVDLLGEG